MCPLFSSGDGPFLCGLMGWLVTVSMASAGVRRIRAVLRVVVLSVLSRAGLCSALLAAVGFAWVLAALSSQSSPFQPVAPTQVSVSVRTVVQVSVLPASTPGVGHALSVGTAPGGGSKPVAPKSAAAKPSGGGAAKSAPKPASGKPASAPKPAAKAPAAKAPAPKAPAPAAKAPAPKTPVPAAKTPAPKAPVSVAKTPQSTPPAGKTPPPGGQHPATGQPATATKRSDTGQANTVTSQPDKSGQSTKTPLPADTSTGKTGQAKNSDPQGAVPGRSAHSTADQNAPATPAFHLSQTPPSALSQLGRPSGKMPGGLTATFDRSGKPVFGYGTPGTPGWTPLPGQPDSTPPASSGSGGPGNANNNGSSGDNGGSSGGTGSGGGAAPTPEQKQSAPHAPISNPQHNSALQPPNPGDSSNPTRGSPGQQPGPNALTLTPSTPLSQTDPYLVNLANRGRTAQPLPPGPTPPYDGSAPGGFDCPTICVPQNQRNPDNPAWRQAMTLMTGQMAANPKTPIAQAIRSDLTSKCAGPFCDAGANRIAGLDGLADMVKTGAPWDHKQPLLDILRNNGVTGRYFQIPGTNEEINYDFWSNLHYGYVAASVGLSENDAVGGAYLYHQISPTNHWGPNKEATIRAGARLFQQHPNSEDMRDPNIILGVIRDNRNVFRKATPAQHEPAYLRPIQEPTSPPAK